MSGEKVKTKARPGHKKKSKKISKLPWLAIILVLVTGLGVFYFISNSSKNDSQNQNSNEIILNQELAQTQPKTGELKTFSGEEFKNLYNSYAYPNTEYISDDAIITGDLAADTQIRKMAEKRGYVRRSAPVQDTFVEIETGMKLQERASQPWLDMKEKAKSADIDLFLTAAYRSADEQREIFLSRIDAIGLNRVLIKTGSYNPQIDEVLSTTAIPGYSRHHTGYTVDIGCGNDPVSAFENTVCYKWLEEENYKNAKTFGWIPSYPEDAGQQGPEPETWEYVWVGIDAVSK